MLFRSEPGEPGLRAIRFVPDEQDASSWPADPSAFHGLDVRVGSTETFVAPPARAGAVSAIDHVVVFTTDPARAIASWRDGRGLRLAFDKEFPARHIRLMFFRSGGLTLEFATPLPVPSEPAGPDRLHGVSYRVPDLEARRAALELEAERVAGTRDRLDAEQQRVCPRRLRRVCGSDVHTVQTHCVARSRSDWLPQSTMCGSAVGDGRPAGRSR